MLEYVTFILGIIVLVKGADYLVQGSSGLAKNLGVSSLVIGLTIVALGTSMPELVVNIIAAIENSSEVAIGTIGTIIGSNLSNILLVLGLTAALAAVKIQKSTVWKEIPFSLWPARSSPITGIDCEGIAWNWATMEVLFSNTLDH